MRIGPAALVSIGASLAMTMAATAVSAQSTVSFRTADGSVICAIADVPQAPPAFAQCAFVKGKLRPPSPTPRGCELDSGYGFTLYRRGIAQGICGGELGNPKRVLAYGTRLQFRGFHCLAISASAGVRCVNPVGHGFVLGASGWRRF
jgi:hypothetical protein